MREKNKPFDRDIADKNGNFKMRKHWDYFSMLPVDHILGKKEILENHIKPIDDGKY